MYLVTPVNTLGNAAPSIAVAGDNIDTAIELAKSKSRLSEFSNWKFNKKVKKLNTRSLSGRKVYL